MEPFEKAMQPSHSVRRDMIDYLCPALTTFPCEYALLFGSRHAQDELAAHVMTLFSAQQFERLIVSGGSTRGVERPEAMEIAEKLCSCGFPGERLILECRATNTAENVILSRQLLQGTGPDLLLVGKLYAKRRYLMTMRQHWPEVARFTCSTINYFDVSREEWWKHPDLRYRIFEEARKIPKYLAAGFISEVHITNGFVTTAEQAS
jgi:uncharacterized SAM-binding protein YcdF (DUF218 family)